MPTTSMITPMTASHIINTAAAQYMAATQVLVVEDERIVALHLRQQLTKRTRFFLGTELPIAMSVNLSHAGVLGAAGLALLQIGLI